LFWRILADTLGAACRLPTLRRTTALGKHSSIPRLPGCAQGAEIRFRRAPASIAICDRPVSELVFDIGTIGLSQGDSLILAVPPPVAARLVRRSSCLMPIPRSSTRIFVAPARRFAAFRRSDRRRRGMVFRKREALSVTVSAAKGLVDLPAESCAGCSGPTPHGISAAEDPVPPARIVKERRPRSLPSRAAAAPAWAATRWKNLVLAGDYVDTGLPATIEGAIRSGFAAAREVLARATIRRWGRREQRSFVAGTVLPRARARGVCFHE